MGVNVAYLMLSIAVVLNMILAIGLWVNVKQDLQELRRTTPPPQSNEPIVADKTPTPRQGHMPDPKQASPTTAVPTQPFR